MTQYRTEQEQFWSGEFGDDYAGRNRGPELLASHICLMSRMLAKTTGIDSVLELGANIGLNMLALRALLPRARLAAVEINAAAWKVLTGIPGVDAHLGSLLEFKPDKPVDLAFTCGVLIHIDPQQLPEAYRVLYESSGKYIAVCEYYNPSPLALAYRGHDRRLFKRDFAGELLSRYGDLRLVDYGFVYHLDPIFPADDLTWFVMQKTAVVR